MFDDFLDMNEIYSHRTTPKHDSPKIDPMPTPKSTTPMGSTGQKNQTKKPHWASSSGILNDSLKTTMSFRAPTKTDTGPPPEFPIQVDTSDTHVGVSTGRKEVPLMGGLYGYGEGPGGKVGIEKTDDSVTIGQQSQIFGVGMGYKGKKNEVELGYTPSPLPSTSGTVFGGKKQGFGFSLGNFSGSYRRNIGEGGGFGSSLTEEDIEMLNRQKDF